MEERRALVLADAEVDHQRARQQVGEGAERDRLRGRMADDSFHAPAAALGPAQRLLGQARLADASRALQDDAATGTFAVVAPELLEVSGPPGERPG